MNLDSKKHRQLCDDIKNKKQYKKLKVDIRDIWESQKISYLNMVSATGRSTYPVGMKIYNIHKT